MDTVSLNYYPMYKNTFLNKNLLTIEFTGMFVVGQLFCVVIKYKKEQYLLACMHACMDTWKFIPRDTRSNFTIFTHSGNLF